MQAPLCRFGDTAANAGMLRLLRDQTLPLWLKTAAASGTAAAWRLLLTPLDTVKVIMQVEGSAGREILRRKLSDRGLLALYDGAASGAAATAAAHWPWFLARLNAAFGTTRACVRSDYRGTAEDGTAECLCRQAHKLGPTCQP